MTLVPLHSSMTNRAAFVNSLFSRDVRDPTKLTAAIARGALTWSYADDGSRALILRAWLEAWRRAVGLPADPTAPPCPAQDAAWVAFFSGYVARNSLDLCTPTLSLHGFDEEGHAVYKNGGYDSGCADQNDITPQTNPGLKVPALHVSCSDSFTNGIPSKGSLGDPNRRVTAYYVDKGSKTCGFGTPTVISAGGLAGGLVIAAGIAGTAVVADRRRRRNLVAV